MEAAMRAAMEASPDDARLRPWGADDERLRCASMEKAGEKRVCKFEGGGRCNIWHVPPNAEPLLQRSYDTCDTFCIVRHPVDRLVSEWQFRTHTRGCGSVKEFRSYLAERFEIARKQPFASDCHLTPQTDFVLARRADTGWPTRQCRHVLRFEHLQEDFRRLMESYRLPLELASHEKMHSRCNFSLPPDILEAIRVFYASDFGAFGYA